MAIYQEGKKVSFLGHKWIIEGESQLGNNSIRLKRINFKSDLRRFGQVATVIDASITDLNKA